MANYAENSRLDNEISATDAAVMLGICSKTLKNWCQNAPLRNPKLKIRYCRKDILGRYWFDRLEIEELSVVAISKKLE